MKNKGIKKWLMAKKIIPGGNMFLSKRPELFLPNEWPTYYKKAKGCRIWDLDDRKIIDFSTMGVGTNILGYSRSEIDTAVINKIKNGSISSLNSVEEIDLAKELVDLHPWAEKVKFARTGGEANTIAIRLARSFTNRENVAICGYHGWQDWYQAANLKNINSLKSHLFANIQISGVSKKLNNTVFPFLYNDFFHLEKIVKKKNIAAVIMEVERNIKPEKDFLNKVKDLCKKKNIVLIFDECTSGFREQFGGLHKKYKITPDICTFGKALGNGYPITAILGKSKILTKSKNSFISSTFWSEGLGPVAAIETLKIMKKEKSWKKITMLGKIVKNTWKELGKKYEIDIKINGLDALPNFYINSKFFLKYKTLISQEMLKHNFLCSNAVYLSTAHDEKIIKSYKRKMELVFDIIKKCEEGDNINKYLKNKECMLSFKRIN